VGKSPAATDDVIFNTSAAVLVDINPTIQKFTVQGSVTVSLTFDHNNSAF
jgi:hypothetical protein